MKSTKPLLLLCAYLISNQVLASNAWQTPDQQAAKLLAQGKAKEAERLFETPHWQGVAQFKSAQYEKAIKTFESLPKSSQSSYNLGNALAHTGKYEKAIKAYNDAIKRSATNSDAIENKKIVEDLLKKQKKDNKSNNNNDQDKQNQDKQNQDKQNQDKQNQDKKNKDKQNQDKQNQDKQNQDKQNQANKNREKNQAEMQQLKRVPDNPGGLLKQKFLRDYINRHPEQRW